MALLGLDYAGGRPGGASIATAGYKFVVRYLTSGGSSLPGKQLTIAEYNDLQDHGIAVVVNFETTATRMKAGFSAGVEDARYSDGYLRQLGYPTNRPIYFSADWDATPSDQAAIDDYLKGAASVLGINRVGIYGGYWPVKRALDNGTAKWAWQTGAWSGSNVDPRIHIYQRIGFATVGGVQCDVNEARKEDFGQYLRGQQPARKAESQMENFPLPAGEGVIKIICPVGSASAITAQAWLSAAVTDGKGSVTVWVQRDASGIAQWDLTLLKDQRWWHELPDGTTQLTVTWKTTAPLGLCLERLPK